MSSESAVPHLPEYITERIKLWEEIQKQGPQVNVPGAAAHGETIQVTLKDGKQIEAKAWETTPMEIVKGISNSLAKNVVVAKVNGKLWDLLRPLESNCTLEFFDFESKEGSHVFWHSSAHILGQAIELEFKDCQLTIGPPLEDGGFYYDVYLPNGLTINPTHLEAIQKRCNEIIKEKQSFSRLVLTKEQALKMFHGNKFKEEIITKRIMDGDVTTAYRCGPLIDLCRGPHVQNTGRIAALKVTRNSSAYWNADATKDQLQRVYGISFPSKAQLDEHLLFLKQAEERDHRRIGLNQQLFFFHPLSPGSAFFLPHGTRIYNKLMNYIRQQYHKRGYNEVVTPNVYNVDLWKQSGHYANYRENMFSFECEGQEFAMKPMNCPGHCLMFAHTRRSYRELPLRLADFGVLHRNEISGALSGLTRVRRFQQDDAHIFARRDQIQQEVSGVLDMLQEVYGHFGFTFTLCLSTRPEKFLGDISLWDEAEAQLKACLDEFCAKHGHSWILNPGDGAFYGPKIDIQLTDALKRKHQCGTCQLDFQLPIRFGLCYRTSRSEESEEKAAESKAQSKTKEEVKYDKNDPEARAARAAAHREANLKRLAEQQKAAEAPAEAAPAPEAQPEAKPEAKPEEKVKKEYEWKEEPLPPDHERPVIIHRAVLGSVERMIAILCEHTGGKWPFWVNPRQVIVIPVSEENIDYARKVGKEIHDRGFYVDVADSNKHFKRKVAEAAVDGYYYALIVGKEEQNQGTVNVRFRDGKQKMHTMEELFALFAERLEKFD